MFHSLPYKKFLKSTKFQAFADNKSDVTTRMISVFIRQETVVGKGDNAGYQHFLLFPQCFHNAYPSGLLKVRILWYRVKNLPEGPSFFFVLGKFNPLPHNATL